MNFPDIVWRTEQVVSRQTIQSQHSALELLNFLSSGFLNQFVDQPTRGSNVLELFFASDNSGSVQSISVNLLVLSFSLVSVLISILVTKLDGIWNSRFMDDGFASFVFSRANYTGLCEAILAMSLTQSEC